MLLLEDIRKEILKPNAFLLKSERVHNVEAKFFPGNNKLSFYIRIFLDVNPHFKGKNPLMLDDISFVKYFLHPSYKNSTRISEDRVNNFEIKIWSYGYFRLVANIYPKIGDEKVIIGYTEFPVTVEEKDKNKTQN